MVRQAIESLYVGRCTITQRKKKFNFLTKVTSFEDEVLCKDEPCRLSYSTVVSDGSANETDTVTIVKQAVKLFLRPELIVDAGSKITVTQHGRTVKYEASGQAAVHTNHQEIMLELEDDKA